MMNYFDIFDYDRNGKALCYTLPRPDEKNHLGLADVLSLEGKAAGPGGDWNFSCSRDSFVCPREGHWRRNIKIYGLSAASAPENSRNGRPYTPLVLPQSGSRYLSYPLINTVLSSLLYNHRTASFSNPELLAMNESDKSSIESVLVLSFHSITYFIVDKVDDESSSWPRDEKWAHGYLYGEATQICRAAYSACAIASGGPSYWIMMNLYLRFTDKSNNDPARTVGPEFFSFIHNSISTSKFNWSCISIYFKRFLDDFTPSQLFMKPREHDALLVDDDTFSRSRNYSWALTSLPIFESCINDTIRQWKVSNILWEESTSRYDPEGWTTVKESFLDQIEEDVEALKAIAEEFRVHRDTIQALRDALFNASAVMETRAANKLAENVKLLTIISIFFLPLAFTTSIFSINNELFNPTQLPWVATIVGLSTYMIVWNLGNILKFFELGYLSHRTGLLARMKRDESKKWEDIGKNFEGVEINLRRQTKSLSEWYILGYWFKGIGRSLRRWKPTFSRNLRKQEDQETGKQHEASPNGSFSQSSREE